MPLRILSVMIIGRERGFPGRFAKIFLASVVFLARRAGQVDSRTRMRPSSKRVYLPVTLSETAPFLKAAKTIPSEAWEQFGKAAIDPWGGMSVIEIMDELRGPVELAAAEQP